MQRQRNERVDCRVTTCTLDRGGNLDQPHDLVKVAGKISTYKVITQAVNVDLLVQRILRKSKSFSGKRQLAWQEGIIGNVKEEDEHGYQKRTSKYSSGALQSPAPG
jgi:hypothetical protein